MPDHDPRQLLLAQTVALRGLDVVLPSALVFVRGRGVGGAAGTAKLKHAAIVPAAAAVVPAASRTPSPRRGRVAAAVTTT